MENPVAVTLKFREIKGSLSGYLNEVLPSHQLSPVMMYTIEFLRKHPDALAVDLAKQLGLTRGAVTQMLDKLENQGLVLRQPHPTSRRSIQIQVTRTGHTLIDAILSEYTQKIEQLFTNYSDDELQTLRQLLDKLPL